jgi:hydroxymethylglutaryl-CoA lyase/(R)-citramalyl-CoA lyase
LTAHLEVTLCDVGPRDGLQNEPETLAPELRAELANRLSEAGLPRIEAASFVNPARVPQMAGAEQVIGALSPEALGRASGLVLNYRGFERARATGIREVHYAFASTDTFNRRNANASVDDGIAAALEVVRAARLAGMQASVTIATAFGCPYEGNVDPGHVLELVRRLLEASPDEIVLADTIGVGTPGQVGKLVAATAELHPAVGVHLHNTRGTGLANAWSAIEAGARLLDASVGGIGGCPFAPRATGNIATEDLLYMLEGEGVDTGVDLDRLINVAAWLEEILGRELPGQVYRAGPFPAAA